MDLVYIVKQDEKNEDLRYSLRSVAKFVPHDNIWIVGYKPSWVTNVKYIPVEQKQDKWKNSINNIIQACKCEEISDNFVLMNDDFFAIRPIKDLEQSISICLGNLDEILKTKQLMTSRWQMAFAYIKELLKDLNIKEPYYNYESHTPLIINKYQYLNVMSLPKVIEFMQTDKVLHKRTLYKNIEKLPVNFIKTDVKIHKRMDDTLEKVKICDWISVYDGQLKNASFPKLNTFLANTFPDQCKYELTPPNSSLLVPEKHIKPLQKRKYY